MTQRPQVLIAGASGVVGQAVVRALAPDHEVHVLTRTVSGQEPADVTAHAWNPTAARDGDSAALQRLSELLSGAAALVNLAGSGIADGRLNEAHRTRVLQSRLTATETLVHAAALAERPVGVWVQGSAVGYYGDQGERDLSDDDPPGSSFLSQVTQAWEAAAAPAAKRSRFVVARLGLVLHPDATAWQRLATAVRFGVGGPMGSGRQWWPWIHANDVGSAVRHLIRSQESRGAYALCAPEPARQLQLTRAAAQRLRRPAIVPAPAFALRALLGGVADELILTSARLRPERLLREGFTFRYPDLRTVVAALLP